MGVFFWKIFFRLLGRVEGYLTGWVVPYGKAIGRGGGGKASWEGAEI